MSIGTQPDRTQPDRNESFRGDLGEVMQVVMRIGVLMLRSGTVSFRVEQAMNRMAKALGADRLDAYVTLTGIMASIHHADRHYTQIARVKSVGVDMNRLSAAERLSQTIPLDCTTDTIASQLHTIESSPPLYPRSFLIGVIAIACGAFAMLNEGGLLEGVAASVGAGIGQTLKLYLQQTRLNLIAMTVVCATIASMVCHLTIQSLALAGWSLPTPQAAFLGAVIFLVPGMPLVTAALDLVRFDLNSGITRTVHALLIMVSVAIGVLLAMPVTGVSIL